jgi:ribosomal protein L11 methyltransferase
MPTFTALTTLSGKAQAEDLGLALENMEPEPTGVGVFELEDGSGLWEVGAYFLETPDDTGLLLLAAAFDARPFAVSELPEIDWVAKVRRELSPVIGGRFYVYGSHDADTVPEGVEPLLIEAAMAFGTGHHGTTLGCLKAFDALLGTGVRPASVADIGCGTAVLAMAAARVLDGVMIASDIDEVAVEVAQTNVVANGLEGRVLCLEATGFEHPEIASRAPFELIFANILMGPLIEMAADLTRALASGGYAILSGLLNEQSDRVIAAYLAQGLGVAKRDEIGEWTTLTLKKP